MADMIGWESAYASLYALLAKAVVVIASHTLTERLYVRIHVNACVFDHSSNEWQR